MDDQTRSEGSSLAAQLRQARKRRGLTQAQLGRALGISGAMVSMIENGDRLLPRELIPMIERFISSGRLPTSDEIAARKTDNPGK
jgi:transcriptional regulator with XRE-family HTH domain